MSKMCRIIGVPGNGAEGLPVSVLQYIRQADVVVAATQALQLFAHEFSPAATQYDLTGQLTQIPAWVAQGEQPVVLATGDPLCHGIGSYLAGKLGADCCEIIPSVSTLQLAFARIGQRWQDAEICSVHSKDAGEWQPGADASHGMYALLQRVRRGDLLAVFTSPENSPARIARMLCAESLDQEFEMVIAERLQQPDERIVSGLDVTQVAAGVFASPNVVILRRRQAYQPEVLFGLPDQAYRQRKPEKGLITKREVRAVSLALMQLRPDSIVWDIGAGSGSVGLEAARLCPRGHVYAVEKNADDAAIVSENRAAMRITNYTLNHAKAPQGLADWPAPDAVFVGGSGGELAELIMLCLQRLKPARWLVMNFVTLENLATAISALKACGAHWQATQLQAARSQPILDLNRMQAENPVWIISAQRGGDES